MKFLIKTLVFFLLITGIENAIAQNASFQLKLRNIEVIEGTLFVSLCSDSLQFAKFTNPSTNSVQKIHVNDSAETIYFKNLEAGWYAIAVFQDLNGNDSLDTKKFKIPAEPFGFSNNAIARFRPPWFKDAKFYINDNKQSKQIVDLVYRKPKKKKVKNEK
jgi:uncharacterized protein (DUF2141 family)